ncbi:acyl-CoA dehydrogenase family protein [Geobacter sp.]|uniref:acyl-CoA dehydrogenase family protein n=1 Tax=Geobacter sp. TaxID=46610 RepID=UPI00262D280C|nr:acyl-CoA dehydrogenase family protein [Geobacter sp.]
MDFTLTEEQQRIRDRARAFTEAEIIPHARENDARERFPAETIRKMGEAGLLGGVIPREYGGGAMEWVSDALLFEEVGRGDSSVRTTISVQVSLVQQVIFRWGSEEQKRRYLPPLCRGELLGCFALTEPGAGSDAAGIATRAERRDGGWVLNGTKTWITNGGVADVAIVFARTSPAAGHDGTAAFLVETKSPGFSTSEIRGKLGLRASNTAGIVMKECRVPVGALLGTVGEGLRIALGALDNGRFGVAAGCVGILRGCVEACTAYTRSRTQFGRPLASFQLVQDMIARMAVDLEAARLLVLRAAELKNRGERNTLETSMAKYFASEAAVRAATDAIQVHGAYGYSNAHPVERYLRDAKVATIYEGTSQIQKLIIGEQILGVRAFV